MVEWLAGNRIRGTSTERTTTEGIGFNNKWDLSTASHVQDFTISGEGSQPNGLIFNTYGTRFYVVGSIRDEVTEYNMSTPWDVSTAVAGNDFSLSTEGIQPSGVWFKLDGTKFFTIDFNSDSVESYTMSRPWDVTSASVNASEAFDISGDSTNPYDMTMSPDGTKLFVVDYILDDLFQYTLTTPYNPSTAGSKVTVDVSGINNNPFGLYVDASGERLYLGGNQATEMQQMDLDTPFDISTLSSVVNSLSTQNGRVDAIFFKPDGTKMYTIENASVVSEYNIGNDNGLGTIFEETDTNKHYLLDDGTWTEI